MAEGAGKRKNRAQRAVLLVIAIVCFAIAAGAAYLIAAQLLDYHQDDSAFTELAEEVKDDTSGKKILKLQKKNPDTAGWIKVKGTRIDYPVMLTPDEPEYYLHRNFKKEYRDNSAGTPFFGEGVVLDGNSLIVYAHHMRDGSMFADLIKFDAKKFASKHKVALTTVDGTKKYKVFAAFYVDLSSGNYYRYWDNVGLLSEKRFDAFVKRAKKLSLYKTDVEPEFGDTLLMLSTCSYGTNDQRFVICTVNEAA